MISPYRKGFPDGSPRTNPMEAYPDVCSRNFQIESAQLMGYIMLLERHLEDLGKCCAACPYRDMDLSGCKEEGENKLCFGKKETP